VLLQEIDDSRYPIFSDIQKNAIIVILDNCSSSQNPQNNLAILKEVILKAEQIDSAVIDLLRKGCEVDLAIDDMPNYDVSSAKADLKYILKRLLIDYLESQASRIIKSGESFDKLSSIRTKISDLTGNKLS
jgi:hypothetical protein